MGVKTIKKIVTFIFYLFVLAMQHQGMNTRFITQITYLYVPYKMVNSFLKRAIVLTWLSNLSRGISMTPIPYLYVTTVLYGSLELGIYSDNEERLTPVYVPVMAHHTTDVLWCAYFIHVNKSLIFSHVITPNKMDLWIRVCLFMRVQISICSIFLSHV